MKCKLGGVLTFVGLCAFSIPIAGLAQSFDALGARMTIDVSGAQTHGRSATMRMVIPSGGTPPAVHVHSREDETFVVMRGSFRFWRGKNVIDAGPGSVVYFPRNVPHDFRNIGKTSGELAVTIVPAGFERFFLEIGQRHLTMPKDRNEIMRLSTLYGVRVVGPPKP